MAAKETTKHSERWERGRKIAGCLLCSTALWTGFSLAAPAVSLASGGAQISGAPVVTYGVQEFGNTATDHGEGDEGCAGNSGNSSWWALPVMAGDSVTIDWEGNAEYLDVLPVGTTDFTVSSAPIFVSSDRSENDKQQLVFSAPVTGSVPLDFSNCDGRQGPYDFTAYVQHEVVLSAPPATSTMPLTGSVSIDLSTAGGAPIGDSSLSVALQIQGQDDQTWTTIGTANDASGIATIAYSIPAGFAGQQITIQASTNGDGAYQSATSTTQSTTIAAEPVPPPPPPPPPPPFLSLRHRGETVTGQLRSRAAGTSITVSEQTTAGWKRLARLRSGAHGEFSYRLPRHVSGTLRFAVTAGSATIRA
jgi:hypothetical protein